MSVLEKPNNGLVNHFVEFDSCFDTPEVNNNTQDESKYKDEEWRLIPDTDGYECSSYGRIKNPNGIILNGHITNKGYKRTSHIKGLRYAVHRLVGKLFVPNYNSALYTQINHIDGDKLNNHKDNLEWVTGSQNVKHAMETKLRTDNVPITCEDLLNKETHSFYAIGPAASYMNISFEATVAKIKFSNQYPINERYKITIAPEDVSRMLNTYHTKTKHVYAYDMIEEKYSEYDAMSHAAYHVGVNALTISKAVNSKGILKMDIGFVFKFTPITEDEIKTDLTKEQMKANREKYYKKPIKVMNIPLLVKNHFDNTVKEYETWQSVELKYDGMSKKQIRSLTTRSNGNMLPNGVKTVGVLKGLSVKYKDDDRPFPIITKEQLEMSRNGYQVKPTDYEK